MRAQRSKSNWLNVCIGRTIVVRTARTKNVRDSVQIYAPECTQKHESRHENDDVNNVEYNDIDDDGNPRRLPQKGFQHNMLFYQSIWRARMLSLLNIDLLRPRFLFAIRIWKRISPLCETPPHICFFSTFPFGSCLHVHSTNEHANWSRSTNE